MKNILKITLVVIGVFFIANQAMAINCICETQVRQEVDETNPYSAGVTIPVTKKVETICPGDSCNSCSKEMYSNCKPLAGNAPAKTEPAEPATFTPNVPIGGQFTEGAKIEITNNLLSEYIKTWYNFIIGAIGILATVMIMYGGLKWLTSRGNSAVIGDAKEKIFSALIGLILVFLSYTILYLVNPNLVEIKPFDLSGIKPANIQYTPNYGSAGKDFRGEGARTPGITLPPPQAKPSNLQTTGAQIPCNDINDTYMAYTASYEGYVARPYWDVNGYSIGYGHHYPNGTPAPSSISQEDALEVLSTDHQAAREAAESTFSDVWEDLNEPRRAALADMAYNMGTGIFAKFPNMSASIHAGNFTEAAEHMLDSDYANQVPQRASNNAELMRNGNNDLFTGQAQTGCQ